MMTQQLADRGAAASAAASPAAAAAATTTHQQMDRFHRYAVNVAETLQDLRNWQQQQELIFKIDETILTYTSSLTISRA